MVRTLFFLLAVAIPSSCLGQAGSGYQLKYVPIPPKPKKVEQPQQEPEKSAAEQEAKPKRPFTGLSFWRDREQLEANAKAHWEAHEKLVEKSRARRAELDRENAKIAAQQQIAYILQAQRQQAIADAYNQAFARAQAEADVRDLRGPVRYEVRPYDRYYDGWGIYVPGRTPRMCDTWIVTER